MAKKKTDAEKAEAKKLKAIAKKKAAAEKKAKAAVAKKAKEEAEAKAIADAKTEAEEEAQMQIDAFETLKEMVSDARDYATTISTPRAQRAKNQLRAMLATSLK